MAMETKHSDQLCQEISATTGKCCKTRKGEREREGEEGVCEECERKAKASLFVFVLGKPFSPFLPHPSKLAN